MEEELYNHIEKKEFLESIESEGSRSLYYHVFTRSKGAELLYQKDLYSFTLEQIEDVFRNLNPATQNSASNNKSRINNYINWAIKHGRKSNNNNPLYGVEAGWEKKFIDKTVKKYYSEHELQEMIDSLYNAQDQALIQCLFEGIMGEGLSELLSLNYKRVNWNKNIVKVVNSRDGKEREIKLSDKCMRYIKNAYQQEIYISEIDNSNDPEKPLINFNDNIFKNISWRSTKNQEATRPILAKRLKILKEKYELEKFDALSINESGRIKMAADIIKENNLTVFGQSEFALIGDRFNLNKVVNHGYEYYNTTAMKKYINNKNLKDLYNIEVEII